ncbi:MAG: peptidoglycan-binding protein [Lachnospiraceae bacterium]|nr:peptidoglycan-binding protein [Lachnospiraceae bacterium]
MRNMKRVISFFLALVLVFSGINISGIGEKKAYAAEDYRAWIQADSRWGSKRLGSGATVAKSGCLATAVTKLAIQAGVKNSSYTVGNFVDDMNANGGFTSGGAMIWGTSGSVLGLRYYKNLQSPNNYKTSDYNNQIIQWIREGYHMVFYVYHNGGQHWVAVDEAKSLATGRVYIMDSLSSVASTDVLMEERYPIFRYCEAYTGGTTPTNQNKNNSALASKVVQVALEQVGYKEGNNNNNKYQQELGYGNNQAWCAYFVAWVMKSAGVPTDLYAWNIRGLAACADPDTVVSGTYHSRESGYVPKPGDTIYFLWNAHRGIYSFSHVGIVVSVTDGKVKTVEGNRDDQVQLCEYSLSESQIKGYGEIYYGEKPLQDPIILNDGELGAPYRMPTRNIQSGHTGQDVRWVQQALNQLNNAGLAVDGIAGNLTKQAIQNYQSSRGLSVDGIVGPITRAKMLEEWNSKRVVDPTGVNLSAGSIDLTVNKTYSLAHSVQPDNASNKAVNWTSSNNGVAKVSNGVVTGVSEGSATITVSTYNGKTASCQVYVHNPVTVKFLNDDNSLLKEVRLDWGSTAEPPANPVKRGYTFSGWQGVYQNVKSNQVVTAKYTKNRYKVTFMETSGTKIGDVQNIYFEEAASEPSQDLLTIPDGYEFVGWSEPFDSVTSDLTIYPVYQWSDEELPMVVSASKDACKANYDEGIYSLNFTVKNHSETARNVKVMTYMVTNSGKLVAQGETRTIRVPAAANGVDGEKTVSDMVVSCEEIADKARIVVLDDYSSAVPMAEIKDVDVEAAGYGEWKDTAPTEGQTEYLERTIYRSKKVNYTTSAGTSNIDGWTRYRQTVDHYDYGGWYWVGNGKDYRSDDVTKSEPISYLNPYEYETPTTLVTKTYMWRGGQVCWIQCALTRYGYLAGVDGIYGSDTEAAVKRFQADNGLQADGMFGSQSLAKMQEKLNADPTYNYYNRSKTPVYKSYFYRLDSNWSEWQETPISGDTSVKPGTTSVLVETSKQYRYKEYFTDDSGDAMTPQCVLPEDASDLRGKDAVAIVFKNKVNQIAEDNVEYIGNVKIGEDGTIDLCFVPREIQTYEGTGDYTVVLGVKGTTNYVKVAMIEAEKPSYTVRFVDSEGNTISEQEVTEGDNAVVPKAPEKTGYIFTGWDTNVTFVNSDLTIMATYIKEKYVVTFVDWEHQSIEQQEYEYGDILEYPDAPEAVEGKEFTGWSVPENTQITENMICVAQFEVPIYEVAFVDFNGEVVHKQLVPYGEAAMSPLVSDEVTETIKADESKNKEGAIQSRIGNFVFVSWGEEVYLDCITSDMTVGAIYEEQLAAEMTANNDTINIAAALNDIVSFQTTATGGAGNYTYRFEMENVLTGESVVLRDFSDNATFAKSFSESGVYSVKTIVRDENDNETETNIIKINVNNTKEPISVKLIVGKDFKTQQKFGDMISFTVDVTGGIGSYTYTYKLNKDDLWINLGETSDNTYTTKVNTFGTLKYKVSVKDSAGSVAESEEIEVYVDGNKVIVKHVDEKGTILDVQTMMGETGSIYVTSAKTIDGYELKEAPSNSAGIYSDDEITVTYVYKKIVASIVGWNKKDGKWYYYDTNGKMVTDWYDISGNKYYFDDSGIMKTGWKKINGKWYYFNSSGVMKTGWLKLGTNYYYLKDDGSMAEDEWVVNRKYYVDKNGVWDQNPKTINAVGTWETQGDQKIFRLEDGSLPKNKWLRIEWRFYHFDDNGCMQTGLFTENGKTYWLKTDGNFILNDWKRYNGGWLHFDKNGYMQTGWVQEEDRYYYMGFDGLRINDDWVEKGKYYVDINGKWVKDKKRQAGSWQIKDNNSYYIFEDGTVPQNQWVYINGRSYHFDSIGCMQKGFFTENGKTYWLKSDGNVLMNAWKTYNGKWYRFDKNGYMLTGWYQEGNKYYYLKEDGSMAANEWVDNGNYYVDANGLWIKNAKK